MTAEQFQALLLDINIRIAVLAKQMKAKEDQR